jgi:hypothetical protein
VHVKEQASYLLSSSHFGHFDGRQRRERTWNRPVFGHEIPWAMKHSRKNACPEMGNKLYCDDEFTGNALRVTSAGARPWC